jgi:hypothetical protein
MRWWTPICVSFVLTLVIRAQPPERTEPGLAAIEFFGHKGVETAAIRAALPFHEGDEVLERDRLKERVREAVVRSVGKEPTDVAGVCCTSDGGLLLFIGIAGGSYKPFAFGPAPTGRARVSNALEQLYDRLGKAIIAAVQKGGDAVEEDRSKGYALTRDPQVRSIQLELRRYAIHHEPELFLVLESSSDAKHRAVASQTLGYARQSAKQLRALTRAARDPDEEVRNNATRAIGVLAGANEPLARQVRPDVFIEMLNSGIWTDRNKGAMVLERLTTKRNPAVLAKLRRVALDSLIEMTLWRAASHAYFARMLLGRVAGVPEERLEELASNGPPQAIVEALASGSR